MTNSWQQYLISEKYQLSFFPVPADSSFTRSVMRHKQNKIPLHVHMKTTCTRFKMLIVQIKIYLYNVYSFSLFKQIEENINGYKCTTCLSNDLNRWVWILECFVWTLILRHIKRLEKEKEKRKRTGKPPTLVLFMIPKGCDFTACRGSSDRRSPDIKIDWTSRQP